MKAMKAMTAMKTMKAMKHDPSINQKTVKRDCDKADEATTPMKKAFHRGADGQSFSGVGCGCWGIP